MRKKPFQTLIIVATSVATLAFINHCNRRATAANSVYISNASYRKSNKYQQKSTHQTHRYHLDSFGDFRRSKYSKPQPYPNRQSKPISSKMAYQLLQILWGNSTENRALLLQKMQKDSIQLQNELSQSFLKQSNNWEILNPNDSLFWFQIQGFSKNQWYRIKRYREKLGGFAHIQQIAEIPTLDTLIKTLVLTTLPMQTFPPFRFISNQSSWKELYQHPYIGPKYAKLIYAYYQTHPHPKFSEIKQIQGIPSPHLMKLLPYLSNNYKD